MRRAADQLPNWPAMMDRAMAASYCSVSEDSFAALAAFYRCPPVETPLRMLRWRKSDLDALIDRLPLRGQPDAEQPPGVLDAAQAALKIVAGQMRRR